MDYLQSQEALSKYEVFEIKDIVSIKKQPWNRSTYVTKNLKNKLCILIAFGIESTGVTLAINIAKDYSTARPEAFIISTSFLSWADFINRSMPDATIYMQN